MRPSTARNGPVGDSEYILYDANAGYQQTLLPVVTRPAKKTGLRSHRHHQHHRTSESEPLERHETPDAVRTPWKPGSSASAFGFSPCVRSRVRAHVRSRVYSRVRTGAGPGGTPGSDQARRPRQQRSLGSERGLATPSPDGKGEISLGPSVTIMPVDSYSTLGRSCEPAFKWIPDPGQARPGRGLRGSVRRSRVAGPRWAATR
jgi:hypothetical protein